MIERDYDIVLKEYFDLTDRQSMKKLLSFNEAEQNQAVIALAAKLYDKIINKVDDIDYGTIPASKGDICNIGNFQEMRDCMDTIRKILVHYKQDTSQLDIVDKSIENIKASKKIWEKAFAMNCELPITFYNNICLAIVSSVSLLISSSIDFIKEPGNQSFSISFDRVGYNKTKDKLLFQGLDKFNKSYSKGEIEKLMMDVIKANKNIAESAEFVDEISAETVMGAASKIFPTLGKLAASHPAIAAVLITGASVVVLIQIVIPVLQMLVNTFYCTKQKLSEYFEVQAKIVQFNAETLKYDYTKSEEQIAKIYEKQNKIATLFKKISNALAVKMNKGDSDARKLIDKEKSEKLTADDLETVDIPGNTSSIF